MTSTTEDKVIHSRSLIGYAVLAENIDSNKASFLDNFLPLIEQGVVDIHDCFTVAELSIYIEQKFGLQFPFYVLDYALRKLCRKNILKYDRTLNNYLLLRKDSLNVLQKRDELLIHHQILISALKEFLHDNYDESYSNQKLEEMLELFLNVSINTISNNSTVEVGAEHKKSIFLVAKFIRHIEKNEPQLFTLYHKFYVGNMISAAMYFTQPDKVTQKFKNTSVYFDTTLIIYALGYAGEDRAQPVLELIKTLRSQHAQLRCFTHTVEEVKGVLTSCMRKLEQGTRDRFGTVEYFISKNYTRSEILTLIHAIEKDIFEKLNIRIVDKPDYSDKELYQYNIDMEGYSTYIQKHITYTYSETLTKDLDSINAIYRLRKGAFSNTIETSKAILVTNNNRLVNVAKDKFILDHQRPDYIPPIISDYVLATLQWIKNPDTESDLPKKMIIANCLVATEPNEKMLQKYLDRIEREKLLGRITEEDFALLRTDSEAKSLMMDKVKGDEEQIIYLNLKELAELTIQRKIEGKDSQLEKQQIYLDQLKEQQAASLELSEKQQQEIDFQKNEIEKIKLDQNEKMMERSRILATKATKYLLLIPVVISSIWFVIAYNRLDSESSLITKVVIQWVIPTAGFLGVGILNFVKTIKEKIITKIAKKTFAFLNK
ncbi:hypothetical protein ABD91_20435 [Lysinibacillus sphaericus]|uniref:hypothetical protein n=1 Tax=Lysinibacillus sphaericus TaxID=1421 RepID=UPI0018CD3A54|nr:hypothetical protein [Lysinibacillus sphaericus]MBG9693116.1 hypothetical protein [Lysinibacillus sphaericus]